MLRNLPSNLEWLNIKHEMTSSQRKIKRISYESSTTCDQTQGPEGEARVPGAGPGVVRPSAPIVECHRAGGDVENTADNAEQTVLRIKRCANCDKTPVKTGT